MDYKYVLDNTERNNHECNSDKHNNHECNDDQCNSASLRYKNGLHLKTIFTVIFFVNQALSSNALHLESVSVVRTDQSNPE